MKGIVMLKQLRISKGLTQKEAAMLLGVSIRSYKTYENDESKENTIKYKYMFDLLSKYGYIDETHGILSLENITNALKDVFKNYDVDYCILFGSYAKGEASEKSDVDLLVSTRVTGMEFFGLAEDLRESLHKKVDLLNLEQLKNNLPLLDEILKNGIKVYKR